MKKWIIIIVVAVIVLGGGAFLVKGKLPIGDKRNNKEAGSIRTTTVRRGSITETVSATGTIEPLVVVEVRSKASGAITKLYVDEGDKLNAGDLIAEIEKTYTKADVDQAQADLKSAQARLVQAQTNIELQKQQSETQIKQAQENLAAAETRLAQLQEQIRLEKEANARQVKEAENALEMARLRLKQAQISRPESVRRAEISVAQAKASLDLAQEEYNRRKALNDKGFVSKSEVDSAKAQLESARAQYESAVEQLKMVQQPSSEEELKLAELGVVNAELALASAKHKVEQEKLREKDLELYKSQVEDAKQSLNMALANKAQIALKEKDLEAAKASVMRAEVALKSAMDKLEDTIVRAPISGTILQKSVEEGQVITSSMGAMASAGTLLVTMANLDNVYVNTDVNEADVGKVQPGQPVTITVDAFPDRKFQGTVLKIAPQGKVVQNVTTFEVITEIENPTGILKPGMNASVEITVADVSDVLVVDNSAIIDTNSGSMVIPVVDGKPADPIPVVVGARGWDTSEIIFGVEEGDVLLIPTVGASSRTGGLPPFMKDMGSPLSTFRRMQDSSRSSRGGQSGPPGPPPP